MIAGIHCQLPHGVVRPNDARGIVKDRDGQGRSEEDRPHSLWINGKIILRGVGTEKFRNGSAPTLCDLCNTMIKFIFIDGQTVMGP